MNYPKVSLQIRPSVKVVTDAEADEISRKREDLRWRQYLEPTFQRRPDLVMKAKERIRS